MQRANAVVDAVFSGVDAGFPVVLGGISNVFLTALFTVVGVILGAGVSLWLHVSGTADRLREKRESQKRSRLEERRPEESLQEPRVEILFQDWPAKRGRRQEAGAVLPVEGKQAWVVYAIPQRPEGRDDWRDRIKATAGNVGRAIRDAVVLAAMVPFMPVFYVVLVTGALWWLEPLVVSLGFSQRIAEGALLADFVLIACSAAWTVTGIRTKRRSTTVRICEAVTIIAVMTVAVAFGGATESVLFVLGTFLLGGWIYLKVFA